MTAYETPLAGVLPGLLTRDLPGTGGTVRARPEDFYVEEIPLVAPSGAGPYVLVGVEKRGIDTPSAVRALARALRVPPARIAYAGLKDAQALARQVQSVEGLSPQRVLRVRIPEVRVLWAERHARPLRAGDLRRNRFVIRIRDVSPGARARARAVLDVLARRGVPNGFGPQRFVLRGDNHRLGRAMVRGDWPAFCDLLLGRPAPEDPDAAREARRAYARGDLRRALDLWPEHLREEREALAALAAGRAPERAAATLPRGLRRLFGAAYQAYLFNALLDARLPEIDRLEHGDLAIVHATDAFYPVEDPAAEQPRADRFEISPSGPLVGFKVRLAREGVGDREHGLLRREGVRPGDFRRVAGARLVGERRAFRVPLEAVEVVADGGDLVLRFALPPGAYATSVLREVTKTEDADKG